MCSKTLKEGGYLAPFWYLELFRDDDELDKELWDIITKYEGYASCMLEKDYTKRMDSIISKIVSSGLLLKPEIIHTHLDVNYTAEFYFNYLSVECFGKKSDDEKQACYAELSMLAEKYNGLQRRYTCELYLTQKK